MLATKQQYQRAIDRARALRTVARVQPTGDGSYAVSGSDGKTIYTVRVIRGGMNYRCNCPAGQRDLPCYHAAGVWLHRVARSSAIK